jgi:hypothetical protein
MGYFDALATRNLNNRMDRTIATLHIHNANV